MRRGKALSIAVVAVTALLISVTPVLGDTNLAFTNNIGQHRLIDTMKKPGVTCTHVETVLDPSRPTWYVFRSMSVRPPRMTAFVDGQRVGWKVIVMRKKGSYSGEPQFPWIVTYRSPTQSTIAHTGTPATFEPIVVPVGVPNDGRNYDYHVQVKMFWYRPSGVVDGWALHEVDLYKQLLDPLVGPNVSNGVYDACMGWQPGT